MVKTKIVLNPKLFVKGVISFTGTSNDSRSEYKTGRGKHRKNFDFALNFKTTASEGIIFYVSDAQHGNFVAIYLKNGQVRPS